MYKASASKLMLNTAWVKVNRRMSQNPTVYASVAYLDASLASAQLASAGPQALVASVSFTSNSLSMQLMQTKQASLNHI